MSQAASSPENSPQPLADADVKAAEVQPAEVETACGVPAAQNALVRRLPIINKRGLHARASAKFVQKVEAFDALVTVCRNGEAVGGNSIMGLMMLAAAPGTSVVVTATGNEAEAVLDALEALVADRFGEEE